MIQSHSASGAKSYFSQALAKADYYLNDQELQGVMHGKLAERLGLTGPVNKDVFFDLCDNVNPATGKSMTPRTNEHRTVGYDINFHCPKELSILHALSNDLHILEAFQKSVSETMQDIERDAKTRVRKDKSVAERDTGELLYSTFIHQTARPVAGHLPDPHLHAHCFVFNATWDAEEQQIKAVQFRDINRDMPYYQARFHKRLSDNLIEQGYQIRRTDKAFSVDGVPQRVVDLFSKRTNEIGRIAKEKGITDIDELGALGARTRSKKQVGHTMAELKAEWRKQIQEFGPDDEGDGKRIVRFAPVRNPSDLTLDRCVDHALDHGFERASVVQDRRLLASAYRHSVGTSSLTLDAITDKFTNDERLIHVKEHDRVLCTTKQVLAEEARMVSLARAGQGKLKPLYQKAPDLTLDGQQADAVKHVLTTTHRVSIIRGAAGSGKTTLMREALDHMKQAGKTVTVVAPTSEASRGVLRDEGFAEAETVAKLLSDKSMQDQLDNQILWVDEAGLLGTQDMTALLALAQEKNARLILGGDTKQHASVVRGDALRILNTVGGIQTAEVSKIYRQRNADYRTAVEYLANGAIKQGFEKLDSINAIQTSDPLKPHDTLVKDYMATIKKGKSALVVSPTHQNSDAVTEVIREKMKATGMLGKKDYLLPRLTSLNLTEAEKADWRNLKTGQLIQFNQNLPGIKRGSRWIIENSSDKGVFIQNEEKQILPLPTLKSRDFDVYNRSDINLAKGDTIRITRNGFDQEKNRLNNGQLLDVLSISKNGELHVRNRTSKADYKLDSQYGHLTHAYCITSHAAQGKTVDEVFITQPASTFPATDAKQFYVSVSRGRDRARIYTDDKEQLLDHAARLGDRPSASELVKRKNQTVDMAQQRIRDDLSRTTDRASRPKESTKPFKAPVPSTKKAKDRDHEPEL
ncbi:conjugative relaxase domain protein [Spirosoma linguale DSM 74]|uniref:Conjugative relaxase domain protein n=2 Tax=Spirosoma TaxID=107 RepID=D2QCL6_SPILD|nr:conjugative relaxase domain protein [Spirosoma linguale DSM 74]